MQSFEGTIQALRQEGFKLTPQRLAVIKFMLGNRDHPSARMIHLELKRKYPTLSFSTVYNTLKVLEKIKEITSIHLFDDHLNYDSNTAPHFHFFCNECGSIHDIFIDEMGGVSLPEGEIQGHLIDSYQAFFKGTCRDCR